MGRGTAAQRGSRLFGFDGSQFFGWCWEPHIRRLFSLCGFSSPSLLHLLHVASNYFWRTHAAAAAAAEKKNRFFGSGGEEEEGLEKSVKNGREVHLLRVRRTNVVLFSPPLHIYGRWCLHARVRPKSSGRLRRRRDYHHRVLPNNKPTDSSFEVGGRGGDNNPLRSLSIPDARRFKMGGGDEDDEATLSLRN